MADYIGVSKSLAIVGVTPKPEINYFYGPWRSINVALNNIPQLARTKGLTVGIIEGSEIVEYWFKNGVELVLKSVDPKLVYTTDEIQQIINDLGNTYVRKVIGKVLIPTTSLDKLNSLPTKENNDNTYVVKEVGKSLIEVSKIEKLDSLPSSVFSQVETQQIINERLKGVKVGGAELIPDANKVVSIPTMVGATASVNGKVGLVPKPLSGQQSTFLRGDGTYGLPNADVVASASYVGGSTPVLEGMTDCSVVNNNVEISLEYPYVAREAFPGAVDIVCVIRNGLVLAEGKDFTIEEGTGDRKKITLIDYPLNIEEDIILVRYKTSIGVYGSVFQETIDNAIIVTSNANTAAQRAEDAADREILLSESEYELLVQNDAVDLTKKYLIYEDDN